MRCAILLMTLALGCEIPLEAETEFEPSSAQRVGNASLFGVYEGESASEDSDGDAWTITVEAYDCGGYLEGEVTRTGSTSFPVSGTVAGNSIEMTAAEDGQEFTLQGTFQSYQEISGLWVGAEGAGGSWSARFKQYSEESTPCRFADVLLAD